MTGTQTQPKPAWDLNARGWELKPSQNPLYLVSEPNEAQVLDVSSQKEFSERQSKKWIYSDTERSTLHRLCAIPEGDSGSEMWQG